MAEPAQTTRPAPLRRDAVLEAVTFAAERLLLAADWHDTIDEVLARQIPVGARRHLPRAPLQQMGGRMPVAVHGDVVCVGS